MPENIEIVSRTSNQIRLRWEGINEDQFAIRYRPFDLVAAQHGAWHLVGPINATEFAINNLLPATIYQVQVERLCGKRESGWADAGLTETQSGEKALVNCGTPDRSPEQLCDWLDGVVVFQRRQEAFVLSWPSLAGNWLAPGSHIEVFVRFRGLDDSEWREESVPVKVPCDRTYTIDSLNAGVSYELAVRANLSIGAEDHVCTWTDMPATTTLNPGVEGLSGPVFVHIPPNVTIACGSPTPSERPEITDECSNPSLSFMDREAIGSTPCERVIERTWIATDDCGKSASFVQTITIVDDQPPEFISIPEDATLPCSGPLPVETPVVIDNCSTPNIVLDTMNMGSDCERIITRIWTATDDCGNTAEARQVIVFIDDTPNPEEEVDVELPEYICGELFEPPYVSSSAALPTAKAGDLFTMFGFPVFLTDVNGGGGSFSGQGVVPLPFGDRQVAVEFFNVQVNADGQITGGALVGMADPEFVLPVGDVLTIGGEICLPEPEQPEFDENGIHSATGLPLDESGFDQNGIYAKQPPYEGYQDGDPFDPGYDPNGFDANGIHVETGMPYNENGCSQTGLTAENQPCDPTGPGPYYWLSDDDLSGPVSEEGNALANEYKDTIRYLVSDLLQKIDSLALDSLDRQRIVCNSLRAGLDSMFTSMEMTERLFVFGANDEYLNEGMSKLFSGAPRLLEINLDRDENMNFFENTHVDLFHCDQSLERFKALIDILQTMRSDQEIDGLVQSLLDKIRRFDEEEAAQYQDLTTFLDWLEDQLYSILEQRYATVSIGYLPNDLPKTPFAYPYWEAPNPREVSDDPFQCLALANDQAGLLMEQALAESLQMTEADLAFQFKQGWEYIGGLHRAYYLDALVRKRRNSQQDTTSNRFLLPVEVSKEINGQTYTLLIDQIYITTQGATCDVYFILPIPTTGQRLVFQALNVPFGPTGTTVESRLALGSDVAVRINNSARLILKGTEHTYVAWDCDGFAGMGVEAEIEFCREKLVPLSPTLEPLPEPEMLKAHFITEMPSWGEFLAEVNIPPFAVKGAEDYKWEVRRALLDFSDTESIDGIRFPDNYGSPFLQNEQVDPMWTGFYLEELRLTMPQQFK